MELFFQDFFRLLLSIYLGGLHVITFINFKMIKRKVFYMYLPTSEEKNYPEIENKYSISI